MNPSTEPREPTCPTCGAPSFGPLRLCGLDAERFLRETVERLTDEQVDDLMVAGYEHWLYDAPQDKPGRAMMRAALLQTLVGVEPPPQEQP